VWCIKGTLWWEAALQIKNIESSISACVTLHIACSTQIHSTDSMLTEMQRSSGFSHDRIELWIRSDHSPTTI
jgi:hypothetical protein